MPIIRPHATPHHPTHSRTDKAERRRQIDRNHPIPVLIAQLDQEVVLRNSRICHQDIEPAHRLLRLRHQQLDLGVVREVAGEHVDTIFELAGKLIQQFAPGPGQGDGRALMVKGTRNRIPNSAGSSGDECGFAGQIEHGVSLPCQECSDLRRDFDLKAATSSAVPIGMPTTPSAMRLTSPLNTLPAPTS